MSFPDKQRIDAKDKRDKLLRKETSRKEEPDLMRITLKNGRSFIAKIEKETPDTIMFKGDMGLFSYRKELIGTIEDAKTARMDAEYVIETIDQNEARGIIKNATISNQITNNVILSLAESERGEALLKRYCLKMAELNSKIAETERARILMEITLKNGRSFIGTVEKETTGTITFRIKDGTVTVDRREIQKLESVE